ncbi:diiron oxygenase [Micromonospora sp. NPDC023633]|uniref:diiron oxygenase n=1 Tax=Micromonospora sp. NPDC023633 TaxID=3154320 RepID=UPI00340E6275
MTGYESPFVVDGVDRWYSKAMVRVRDNVLSGPGWQDSYTLYNRVLTPYTQHPLVERLGPDAILQLGAGRLADYLAKTEIVEIEVVNRAVEGILKLPAISEEMRADLLKIYTDEGYHVLMMAEFRRHIQDETGIWLARRPTRELASIAELVESFPPEKRPLAVICCAIVTETLITATLRQAGGDTVYPPVTRMLAEHAADEARHHAFFHRFAELHLPPLIGSDTALVEEAFRRVLWYFLCPDFRRLRDDLVGQGLTVGQADRVVDESFDRADLREQFLAASVAPRRLFASLGLEAGDAFAEQLNGLDHVSLLSLTTFERSRGAA